MTVAHQTLSRIETIPASGDISRIARLTTSDANEEGFRGFAWTPDKRIVYSSFEGSQSDIWIMNSDGSRRQRLTSDVYLDAYTAVSADGRYVVFVSNRPNGGSVPFLWRMDIDGSNLTRLTVDWAYVPDISPDGRSVIYFSDEGPSLRRVSIDGGESVRIAPASGDAAAYSPDGQWIACFAWDKEVTPKRDRNTVIRAAGGRPVKQFDFPGFQYAQLRWAPDGRHLSYIGSPPDPSNIWLQPVDGGEPRQLTDFKSEYIYRHAWSRDGRVLALARGRVMSDVVLMKETLSKGSAGRHLTVVDKGLREERRKNVIAPFLETVTEQGLWCG